MDAAGVPKQKSAFQAKLQECFQTTAIMQARKISLLVIVMGCITGMWILLPGSANCVKCQRKVSFSDKGAFREMFTGRQEAYRKSSQCNGRRIYIHDLPAQFNSEIVERFCSDELSFLHKCESYDNGGLGGTIDGYMEPVRNWYRTEHFSLEILFHERLKHYRCRTKSPDVADLFYLPYYTGLDLKQHLHHDKMQLRDFLVERFIGWLLREPTWTKTFGKDHFMLLGRPVWDFSRPVGDAGWGNSLVTSREIWNLTKLMVERDPATPDPRQVAIPYPTSFHPTADSDIKMWQKILAESNRELLVALTGSPRNATVQPQTAVRHVLYEQCEESDRCRSLLCTQVDCRRNPQLITDFFLSAKFCLQPPGDSATRKSVFDCLVAGAIPVFFSEHTAYTQFLWHLPSDGASYSIFIDQAELMADPFSVVDHLAQIPDSKVEQMQTVIREVILPSVVYDDPRRDKKKTIMDAFDITLEHILNPTFRGTASPGVPLNV